MKDSPTLRLHETNKNKEDRMERLASFDELPYMLRAEDVARVLGVSRANAYVIMHSKGFPKLQIGKRMMVPKDKLQAWIDAKSGGSISPKI